jgi:RNA ligase
MENEFVGFPKMARLSRPVIVTEKIDGTNAQIFIECVPVAWPHDATLENELYSTVPGGAESKLIMRVGSRTRYLREGEDNHGFFAWCRRNAEELFKLGHGRHFGEWWGCGIQRGYGLKEKRFSLFNTQRWTYMLDDDDDKREVVPYCCHIVPILWQGMFDTKEIRAQMDELTVSGSRAVPGFMKPEGIVIWHDAGHVGFKKTIEKDEQRKGKQ